MAGFPWFSRIRPGSYPGLGSQNSRKTLKNRHSKIFTHLHTAGCASRGENRRRTTHTEHVPRGRCATAGVRSCVNCASGRCAKPVATMRVPNDSHVPYPNLMLGLAGTGYFYLRLYDPDADPSVLIVAPGIGPRNRQPEVMVG